MAQAAREQEVGGTGTIDVHDDVACSTWRVAGPDGANRASDMSAPQEPA